MSDYARNLDTYNDSQDDDSPPMQAYLVPHGAWIVIYHAEDHDLVEMFHEDSLDAARDYCEDMEWEVVATPSDVPAFEPPF